MTQGHKRKFPSMANHTVRPVAAAAYFVFGVQLQSAILTGSAKPTTPTPGEVRLRPGQMPG